MIGATTATNMSGASKAAARRRSVRERPAPKRRSTDARRGESSDSRHSGPPDARIKPGVEEVGGQRQRHVDQG